MKIISKSILYFILISLPLLFIAGLISFLLIRNEIKDGTDESLLNEKYNAEKLLNAQNTSKEIYLSADSLSKIIPINTGAFSSKFSDTTVYFHQEDEIVSARLLRSYYEANGNAYQITIVKSTLEEEELLESIVPAFMIILAFLISSLILANWFLSKKLWNPFYITLEQLNNYEIKNHAPQQFTSTNTLEFHQLNQALNKLMDKIYCDYIEQKEFVENASHEMQTPLAVIKANLNLLIQSENLNEVEMNQLQTIDNTIKKLTSLNKSLLLLSKIENKQFIETENLSITAGFEKIYQNYSDFIEAKKIKFHLKINEDWKVTMNPDLAEILISNLLQNAIRHNIIEGKIEVIIDKNSFTISNTGQVPSLSEDEIFQRFKKNDATQDSLGLGLSIVKSILKTCDLRIEYHYKDFIHQFRVFAH